MKKTESIDNRFVSELKVDKKLRERARRIEKHVKLLDHVFVVSLSLFIGIILFLFINTFFLPQALPLPKTTVINWLVLNNHSMTLDYIRFGLFVFIIPVSIVTGWIMLIWQKNR